MPASATKNNTENYRKRVNFKSEKKLNSTNLKRKHPPKTSWFWFIFFSFLESDGKAMIQCPPPRYVSVCTVIIS